MNQIYDHWIIALELQINKAISFEIRSLLIREKKTAWPQLLNNCLVCHKKFVNNNLKSPNNFDSNGKNI